MNGYIQLILNGLSTGLGVLFANWLYDKFVRKPLDHTHRRIKRVFVTRK